MVSIHDLRFFNFAILDILGTFVLAYITYWLCGGKYINHLIGFEIFAIFIHWFLGIDTTLNYYLGISNKPTMFINNPPLLWLAHPVQ